LKKAVSREVNIMATEQLRGRSDCYTFDDFCAIVVDGQKADLINGVIHVTSPDNTSAGYLFSWLCTLLFSYTSTRELGRVYGSRVAFRLDKANGPEPDLAVVLTRHYHRIKPGRVEGPPDLAMEIVSPESVERDYDAKRKLYEQHGVPEYWIIDEEERKVTVFRLDGRGKYRVVRPRKGVYHSQVLTGFWLDPRWLWQDPLPNVVHVLQLILGQKST
jgi:Uma2 family endonuclease